MPIYQNGLDVDKMWEVLYAKLIEKNIITAKEKEQMIDSCRDSRTKEGEITFQS